MAKKFANLKEWWSGKARLPFFNFVRPAKNWRAKKITLKITRAREFVITIRRFKTGKQNRSKTNKQLVLSLRKLPGKTQEIVFRHERRRVRKNERLSLQRAASMGLVAIGLSGVIYFGGQIVFTAEATPPPPATVSIPALEQTQIDKKQKGLSPSEPTQLRIAGIEVDTKIIAVGQQIDGTMETPPMYSHNAGWYELGPTPGELGPAIIVGHVGTQKGPSVFWRLGTLQPDDKIEVARKDGKTVKFIVTKVAQFDQNNFPTQEVYGNTDNSALRLITCGGTFDNDIGRYTHNTVVFADMIEY